MQIAMIGTGYVGLVSGVCFSEYGFSVTCVDRDVDKIKRLENGEMPIFEPGLDSLVAKNVKAKKLNFTTDLPKAVSEADVVFIAVGTPQDEKSGSADLSQLFAVADQIAPALTNSTLVVVKSTVPVGTTRMVADRIAKANPDVDFEIASNPEFLREGAAIEDFTTPDRIIVGIDSKRSREVLAQLYEPICLNGPTIFFTTLESAEMIKYTANSMLALRIAFINEISDLCEATGANVRDVSFGVGLDSRIGPKFLQPGPGYGGSCFPKDTRALAHLARENGKPSRVVEAAIESNDIRKLRMAHRVIEACGGSVRGKTVAVLGLTFKPGTDDMRESPSLVILPELVSKGATIRAYDPQGAKEAEKLLGTKKITYCDDPYATMQGADVLVLITEWNEFRRLDPARMKQLLKNPLIVDFRNVYKRQQMMDEQFCYISLGRRPVIPGEPWIPDLNPSTEAA